jgi:hypothetical protein
MTNHQHPTSPPPIPRHAPRAEVDTEWLSPIIPLPSLTQVTQRSRPLTETVRLFAHPLFPYLTAQPPHCEATSPPRTLLRPMSTVIT